MIIIIYINAFNNQKAAYIFTLYNSIKVIISQSICYSRTYIKIY